jgi:hypothetical protein
MAYYTKEKPRHIPEVLPGSTFLEARKNSLIGGSEASDSLSPKSSKSDSSSLNNRKASSGDFPIGIWFACTKIATLKVNVPLSIIMPIMGSKNEFNAATRGIMKDAKRKNNFLGISTAYTPFWLGTWRKYIRMKNGRVLPPK